MNEAAQTQSYVDPEILERMTPEGRDLLERVFESTDLVIVVTDASKSPISVNTESKTEREDIISIKNLPANEQIAWLLQNFTRRTLSRAVTEGSRKPRLDHIFGEDKASEMREAQIKRAAIRKGVGKRQTFRSAVTPKG